MSELDLAKLGIAAGAAIASAIADRIANGDGTVLAERVADLLPIELHIELAKASADARALAKFSPEHG